MDTAEKLIPGIDTKIVLDELYYTVKGAMKKLIFIQPNHLKRTNFAKKYGIRLFSRFCSCIVRFKSV